ncbi:MAG: hypothetical protein ACKOKF_08210 [Bacteroidota bacterium]
MSNENKRPNIINTKKASSHPLKPGRFYKAKVTAVDSSGRVNISVNGLGNGTFEKIVPIGTTELNKMQVGDTVMCTFTDEYFNDVVVFGASRIKSDVFASKVLFEQLVTRVAALEARYNSHTSHPPPA